MRTQNTENQCCGEIQDVSSFRTRSNMGSVTDITETFEAINITQDPKYELSRIIENAMVALAQYIEEGDEDLIDVAYFELQLATELLKQEI